MALKPLKNHIRIQQFELVLYTQVKGFLPYISERLFKACREILQSRLKIGMGDFSTFQILHTGMSSGQLRRSPRKKTHSSDAAPLVDDRFDDRSTSTACWRGIPRYGADSVGRLLRG